MRTKEKLQIVCSGIIENGGSSIAVQADITDKTQCDKIINVAIEKYETYIIRYEFLYLLLIFK